MTDGLERGAAGADGPGGSAGRSADKIAGQVRGNIAAPAVGRAIGLIESREQPVMILVEQGHGILSGLIPGAVA